jgi:hypothetical protein
MKPLGKKKERTFFLFTKEKAFTEKENPLGKKRNNAFRRKKILGKRKLERIKSLGKKRNKSFWEKN